QICCGAIIHLWCLLVRLAVEYILKKGMKSEIGLMPLGSAAQTGQLVQPVDISACASLDDVGGSAPADDLAAVFLHLHGDLAHGFGAARNRANLIALELGRGFGYFRDGLAGGVHRTVANSGALARSILDADPHRGGGNGRSAAIDLQVFE